uniref:Uncharacterized protein n=1 Tax=Anopheles minimus TaxID=112268 RepID=A0A182WP24_9DIPT
MQVGELAPFLLQRSVGPPVYPPEISHLQHRDIATHFTFF